MSAVSSAFKALVSITTSYLRRISFLAFRCMSGFFLIPRTIGVQIQFPSLPSSDQRLKSLGVVIEVSLADLRSRRALEVFGQDHAREFRDGHFLRALPLRF